MKLRRKTHLTIKKVTEDLDGGFHFNTAISAVMELVNEMYDVMAKPNVTNPISGDILKEAVTAVIVLLSPFVPHLAEELWQALGKRSSIFKSEWPSYDKSAILEKVVTVVIQINGKLRSRIDVPFDMNEDELKRSVLGDAKVKDLIRDKAIRDFIVVPKKLVNIVCSISKD
ncbi:MAG: class I tRNA ligase family protein [Candidatus Omnitrophica bacterium]|nr:class I tRNA ligase family protein [Candidatus Omnitrophota bacterium]